MTQDQIDNWVIAYMEGTLEPEERNFVREQLRVDTQWQLTLQRFRRTRQKPDSQITFPWKEQLYKSEPRLTLSKSLPSVLVAAALCVVLGFGTYQQSFFQTDKSMVTQDNVQKHSNEADESDLSSAGISFDFNTILHSKSDTAFTARRAKPKPHTKANLKKPRKGLSASNQQKEVDQNTQGGSQLAKIPRESTGGKLSINKMEATPKAPTIADFSEIYAFTNGVNNQVDDGSKNEQTQKVAENSQQKSLLEKAVAKVFNVEIQRNQSESSNDKSENSLQIETNPLAIQAKIRFN